MINLNDKVYVRDYTVGSTRQLYQGIVVAKKTVWTPLPAKRYVVKKIVKTEGIVGVLSDAFYGPADELKYCTGDDLILVPIIDVEKDTK